jgi:hypothetical protein
MLLRLEEVPTMTHWIARLELGARRVDPGALLEALTDFQPVVGRTPQGRTELAITLPGESLRQAVILALAVTSDVAGEVYAVEVVPAEEFQRRRSHGSVPELLSVSEAAAELGVSPQAIRQRLDGGTVAGTKIGGTWAVLHSDVRRLQAGKVPLAATDARPPNTEPA